MAKSAEAFRSIGEVATLIGVAPHVLRYWETQFATLKPMKRPDGRRYYRPADVDLAAGICALLREDGMTIKGARRLIALDRGEAVRQRGITQLALPQVAQQDRDPPPMLPLLPDGPAPSVPVPVTDSDARWLMRLTTLSRSLQGIGPFDPARPQLRAAALGLAQAMLRLS